MTLVWNILLTELDPVVGFGPPAQEALLYDPLHVLSRVMLRGHWLEPVLELFDGLTPETGQPCVQHEGHQGDDCLVVRSDSQVSLDTKFHEPLEWRCLHGTTHYIDHFISQLEMGLPAKVPSWGTLKIKACFIS